MDGVDERERIEAPIRGAFEAQDFNEAARCLIEIYGRELIGFLNTMLSGPDEAGDAFQMFCEQMWKGLPKFRAESSFRTWAYTLARTSAARHRRSPHRPAERRIPLSSAPEVEAAAHQIRTRTVEYLRTEVKERVAMLREQLEPEERALFTLRINRRMSWPQIVLVMEGELEPNEAQKRAAALRKKFQRAKDKLRELVAADPELGRAQE